MASRIRAASSNAFQFDRIQLRQFEAIDRKLSSYVPLGERGAGDPHLNPTVT